MSPQFSLVYGLTTQNLLTVPSSGRIILRLMLLAWKGLFKSTKLDDILPACLAGYHTCPSNYKQRFWQCQRLSFALLLLPLHPNATLHITIELTSEQRHA